MQNFGKIWVLFLEIWVLFPEKFSKPQKKSLIYKNIALKGMYFLPFHGLVTMFIINSNTQQVNYGKNLSQLW